MRSLESMLICLMLWFQPTLFNQEITLTCEQTLNENESQVFSMNNIDYLNMIHLVSIHERFPRFALTPNAYGISKFPLRFGKEWKLEEMENP